jgi:hypothetical protein
MSKHETADPNKLRVETKPFAMGLGASPKGTPMARPDLAGVRMKLPNDPAIYLIDPDGYRRWIPDPETYNNMFRNWDGVIVDIDVNDIAVASQLSHGALLIKASSSAPVYLLSNGIKRWITAPEVMDKYYFSWDRIYQMPPAVVDAIPRGLNWT